MCDHTLVLCPSHAHTHTHVQREQERLDEFPFKPDIGTDKYGPRGSQKEVIERLYVARECLDACRRADASIRCSLGQVHEQGQGGRKARAGAPHARSDGQQRPQAVCSPGASTASLWNQHGFAARAFRSRHHLLLACSHPLAGRCRLHVRRWIRGERHLSQCATACLRRATTRKTSKRSCSSSTLVLVRHRQPVWRAWHRWRHDLTRSVPWCFPIATRQDRRLHALANRRFVSRGSDRLINNMTQKAFVYIFNALQASTPDGVPALEAQGAALASLSASGSGSVAAASTNPHPGSHAATGAASTVPRSVTSEMLRDADDASIMLPDVPPQGVLDMAAATTEYLDDRLAAVVSPLIAASNGAAMSFADFAAFMAPVVEDLGGAPRLLLMVKKDAKARLRRARHPVDMECTFRPSVNPASRTLAAQHADNKPVHVRAVCGVWCVVCGVCGMCSITLSRP